MQYTVYLSQRNVKVLLSKLNRIAAGEQSQGSIIKHRDPALVEYPQTHDTVQVSVVEDGDSAVDSYWCMGYDRAVLCLTREALNQLLSMQAISIPVGDGTVEVFCVENDLYYKHRRPGEVHRLDEPRE